LIVAWVVLGIALLLFEMHHLAFYALFLAVGSLVAAAVAGFAPDAIAAQAAVAVGTATAGVVLVRPWMSRTFHHRRAGQVAIGVHGGLVGQPALTLDAVGVAHDVGHVRLGGERWLAVSGSGAPIAPNTRVLVLRVQGTTLVVLPVDELEGG
jgi:membrane protein implicated in regulation of membrane protease activity